MPLSSMKRWPRCAAYTHTHTHRLHSLLSQQASFLADVLILSYCTRKGKDVTNYINDAFAPFKCPNMLWQCGSIHNEWDQSGVHPSLDLIFPPVLSLLSHVVKERRAIRAFPNPRKNYKEVSLSRYRHIRTLLPFSAQCCFQELSHSNKSLLRGKKQEQLPITRANNSVPEQNWNNKVETNWPDLPGVSKC